MLQETSFVKTQYLLNKAMGAESMRWNAITNNIANADTPYFKRSDVKFESQLLRALKSEEPQQAIEVKRTLPTHISSRQSIDYRTVEPQVHLEFDSTFRNDKNNLDVDKEMALAAKTTLRYNAFSSLLSRNFRKIGMLVRG